jgi:hypothetical protein
LATTEAGNLHGADRFAVIDGVRVEHNGGDGISVSPTTGLSTSSIERSVMVRDAAAGISMLRALSPVRTDASFFITALGTL